MLRICVLVSGGGTNLQAILDRIDSGQLNNATIVKVVSNRSKAYALQRAKEKGIETEVIRPNDYPQRREYTEALIRSLEDVSCDLVVLAGFLVILESEFIQAFRNRIVNVHPSLLPAFGGKGYYGLRVHKAALERGVKLSGATVHLVDEVPDGGPILYQKAVPVMEGDTPEVLQQRVMEEAEWELLPKAIQEFDQWSLRFRMEERQ